MQTQIKCVSEYATVDKSARLKHHDKPCTDHQARAIAKHLADGITREQAHKIISMLRNEA